MNTHCSVLIFAHQNIKLQIYDLVIVHLIWQCLVHAGIVWCKCFRNESFASLFQLYAQTKTTNWIFKVCTGFKHLSIVSLEAGTCMVWKALLFWNCLLAQSCWPAKLSWLQEGRFSDLFTPLLFHCWVVCAEHTWLPRWLWERLEILFVVL